MPCDPRDNSLNPPPFGPPPNIPGFGVPFAPLQVPYPDVDIPVDIPEDIIALIQKIFANWPGGLMIPQPDNLMKEVWDAVAKLLNSLSPWLTLYNFFQALLEMISCIIEVLCALLNPWATARAIRRLQNRCLPNFLKLFPWLALVAMILALLALLWALLLYIIELLLAYLRDIIANLEKLGEALSFEDETDALAIARKIAYLLCLLEQLFAILIALQAIFAVIEALMQIGGARTCNRDDGDPCCGEEYCPDFISKNPNGISGNNGRLTYHNQRYQNVFSGVNIVVREEHWQFVNLDSSDTYQIKDIITPVGPDDDIFWPIDMTFPYDTQLKRCPYLINMRVYVDPSLWDTSVSGNARWFQINDIIVERKPYLGVLNWENDLDPPNTGTFWLVGGKVYEENGTTPVMISGVQAKLTDLIHKNALDGGIPTVPDGYDFNDLEFTWTFHHAALVDYSILTEMCLPELSGNNDIINATIDYRSVADKMVAAWPDYAISPGYGKMPDLGGTVENLTKALSDLRSNVSVENCAAFQDSAQQYIEDLQNQTVNAFNAAAISGTDIYHSTVELTPDLQFVGSPIDVTVQLRDANDVNLITNPISDVANTLADKISGSVTVGNLSSFSYDGYGNFVAEINSDTPGAGELRVTFDEQILSELIRDDDDSESQIVENVLNYEFVGAGVVVTSTGAVISVAGEEPKVRRDESDV